MSKTRDPIGPQRRFVILQRDNFTCLFCGGRPGNDRLHVDHFVPHSRGGSIHDNNLGTACDRCNTGKSNRIAIPLALCTKEHDRQGWVIWRRWGNWVLSWNPEPAEDPKAGWPFVDASCAIALTFEPEEYWIALDRVHEQDWHEHIEWKPWMRDDADIAVLDAHHKQLSQERRKRTGHVGMTLAEFMDESRSHSLERHPARGERWGQFCDAIDFARTLIRPPERRTG